MLNDYDIPDIVKGTGDKGMTGLSLPSRSSLWKSRKVPTILAMQPPKQKQVKCMGNIGGVLKPTQRILGRLHRGGSTGAKS